MTHPSLITSRHDPDPMSHRVDLDDDQELDQEQAGETELPRE